MKRLLATLTLLVFCAACSPEVDHQVANVIEQKAAANRCDPLRRSHVRS